MNEDNGLSGCIGVMIGLVIAAVIWLMLISLMIGG